MYVAHYAFYVACILRSCDRSTGFFIQVYTGYGYGMDMVMMVIGCSWTSSGVTLGWSRWGWPSSALQQVHSQARTGQQNAA